MTARFFANYSYIGEVLTRDLYREMLTRSSGWKRDARRHDTFWHGFFISAADPQREVYQEFQPSLTPSAGLVPRIVEVAANSVPSKFTLLKR